MRRIRHITFALRQSRPVWVPAIGMALAIVGFVLAASSLVTGGCGGDKAATTQPTVTVGGGPATTAVGSPTRPDPYNFGEEKKSDHFANKVPSHRAIMPAPPLKVTIYFDSDLAPSSQIDIKDSSGSSYATGATELGEGNQRMSRGLDQNAADGLYSVEYTACFADGGCSDGSFRFAIEKTPGH